MFDEIEKAHPDVMNILLQILEDGRLTDSQGKTVNFQNTIIIMTSNIGARLITDKKQLGFSYISQDDNAEKNTQYESTKKEVIAELKKELKPEFINRIDEIIVFNKLVENEILEIIEIMLNQVKQRLEANNILIDIDKSVKDFIFKKGFDKNYGARPLRRAIQNFVEDAISDAILNGKITYNKKMLIKVNELGDGNINFLQL